MLLLQFSSLGPGFATAVYCIGDDGHAGVEVVRAGRGCASCCHEARGDSHDAAAAGRAAEHVGDEVGGHVDGAIGGEPGTSECHDVDLTPEAETGPRDEHAAFVAGLGTPLPVARPAADCGATPCSLRVASRAGPPALALLRPVVLLI